LTEEYGQIKEIEIPIFTSKKEAKKLSLFIEDLLRKSNFNTSCYVYEHKPEYYSISVLSLEIPEIMNIWKTSIDAARENGVKIVKIFR
jgi:hypothetical protein